MTYSFHLPDEKNAIDFFKKSLKIKSKLSLKTAVFNWRLGEKTVALTISRQGSPVWEDGVPLAPKIPVSDRWGL